MNVKHLVLVLSTALGAAISTMAESCIVSGSTVSSPVSTAVSGMIGLNTTLVGGKSTAIGLIRKTGLALIVR